MKHDWRRTEMTYIQTETVIDSEAALTMLMHLKNGNIKDATACFAERFQYNDRGIGLGFEDTDRLVEFFQKTRELYPDSSLQTDRVFVSGDHVVTEWTLRATLTEPFYGGLSRKVPVSGLPSCEQRTGRLLSGRTTATD
jgi:hypothetical protein